MKNKSYESKHQRVSHLTWLRDHKENLTKSFLGLPILGHPLRSWVTFEEFAKTLQLMLFLLIYEFNDIKSRFHMNVAWKAQPSSTFRFWISSLWSMKSGDIFQTFSDQRWKYFSFKITIQIIFEKTSQELPTLSWVTVSHSQPFSSRF